MKKLKYIVLGLVLLAATMAYAGVNDRMSPIELSDYTGNLVSEYCVQLASVFVDGTGPISSVSTPNLTTVDNVGAIVYDNSGETTEIQFTHKASPAFGGLELKILATSSLVSGNTQGLDWSVFIQTPDASLGTAIAQQDASFVSNTMDVDVEEITLKLNATAINLVKPGKSVIHIAVWNNGTSDGTTEIKGITVKELWK